MRAKKAQASVEYVVLTAFMLVVTGVFFGFALFFFNENAATAQSEDAVVTLVNQANKVSSLGEGSKIYFEVDVPFNVQSLEVANKTVSMRVANAGGTMDIIGYSRSNLTPATFNPGSGHRAFSAEFLDGNVVVEELA